MRCSVETFTPSNAFLDALRAAGLHTPPASHVLRLAARRAGRAAPRCTRQRQPGALGHRALRRPPRAAGPGACGAWRLRALGCAHRPRDAPHDSHLGRACAAERGLLHEGARSRAAMLQALSDARPAMPTRGATRLCTRDVWPRPIACGLYPTYLFCYNETMVRGGKQHVTADAMRSTAGVVAG